MTSATHSARRSWIMLIVLTMLTTAGMTVVLPVLPFVVLRDVPQGRLALWVGNLEAATGLESRVTILGYVQRGGTPCAADRLLATRLGTAAADLVARGEFGVMVGARGEGTEAVPLAEVAGKVKLVPVEHEWITAARQVGTGLGD